MEGLCESVLCLSF